ncbi:hypothetical protein BMG00_12430 [Thioclava marina]|uniref:Protein NO VEIN C-terminal domain-containing protein n=1 Tax=Thioclava marina TaxID=1915077 RepID=A0ABX3MKW9_9RHOB|nr:DUF3883 domain-containing protein [Thioclava marina]OOY11881.1 hypothetical protein BMG00_12430 [Thioclava marina]
MAGEDWSEAENAAIVAEYFAMLADDLSGKRYNKAAHNRDLQSQIDRSRGSIAFKHQNISAVLKSLGETWISGYKPAFNFQASLEDVVSRQLQKQGGWIVPPTHPGSRDFQDATPLWPEPPPTQRNTPPPGELEQMLSVARKFDVAGRDERNRALGKMGEERVLHHEQSVLRAAGRDDLAREIVWVSQQEGDGAGYDIRSFTPEGQPRLIEVKTTNGWERTPFHISRNELAVADDRREDWVLFRLYQFSRGPRAFELRPPLDAHVSLTATSFRASFD